MCSVFSKWPMVDWLSVVNKILQNMSRSIFIQRSAFSRIGVHIKFILYSISLLEGHGLVNQDSNLVSISSRGCLTVGCSRYTAHYTLHSSSICRKATKNICQILVAKSVTLLLLFLCSIEIIMTVIFTP